ncbi:MAG: hypothetical protein ACYTKD_30155 [Planctomycetota bacterium]
MRKEHLDMVEEDKKQKSKMGKLVGGAVGSLGMGIALIESLGWLALVVGAGISVALIIKIVKMLKQK